jgi:hypothetical protein
LINAIAPGSMILSIMVVLAGCAGVPAAPTIHAGGELCLRMDSDHGDDLEMQVCNCGPHPVALSTGFMPWDPIQRDGLTLTVFDGANPIAARKRQIPFVHTEPGLRYQVPVNECLKGHIDLRSAFFLDEALPGNLREVEWSGSVYGFREQWPLSAKIDLSTRKQEPRQQQPERP